VNFSVKIYIELPIAKLKLRLDDSDVVSLSIRSAKFYYLWSYDHGVIVFVQYVHNRASMRARMRAPGIAYCIVL
jgi:hypothetical protein